MLSEKFTCPLEEPGEALRDFLVEDSGGTEGKQADHRTDFQTCRRPIGEAKQIVKESVFLVPHLVLMFADTIHGGTDPEKMLKKLQGHVFIDRVVHRQFQRNIQHVLTEQRHPSRAVGLFQIAACRQCGTPIEDPDIVETEKSSLEYVPSTWVLAIDPPGEVQD